MTTQAALIADTIARMKRRVTTLHDASDSDESIAAPRNNGNKLKRKAKFVREGRLAMPVGKPYKLIEHAGYKRVIIGGGNPPRIDQDGFELDDEEVDSEADAMAAEHNPYAGIKIEKLLAPLTFAADLPTHPTLSKPYTSKALPELVLQARDMLQKERASLWRMKQLFTQFRGDAMWIPCGRLETANDAAVFDELRQMMGTSGARNIQEDQSLELGLKEHTSGQAQEDSSTDATVQVVTREEPNPEDQGTPNEPQENGELVDRPPPSSIEALKADAKMKVDGGVEEPIHEAERQQSPGNAKPDESKPPVNSSKDQEQQRHPAEDDTMDTGPDGPVINETTATDTRHLENGDVQPETMDTTADDNPEKPNPDGSSEMNTSGTLPAENTSSPPPQSPSAHPVEDNKLVSGGDENTTKDTTSDQNPTTSPATQQASPPPVLAAEPITITTTTATAATTTTATTAVATPPPPPQQPHHMTTRLRQAQSSQPPPHRHPTPPPPLSSTLHLSSPSQPEIHPIFLLPPSTRPDPTLGLPPNEADDTRRLIMLYVQKQEEVVRASESMYEMLLKADRMRRNVFEACNAEGHDGEMSDGEDWVDLKKWGLKEGELRKGVDDEEEDNNEGGGGEGDSASESG